MDREVLPWERQPYESAANFALFMLYLQQDHPRSVNRAYQTHRINRGEQNAVLRPAPGSWRNIVSGKTRHGADIPGSMTWQARAMAWDDYLAAQERDKWAARRLELREREWDASSKLLQRSEEMLRFPVTRIESADGMTIVMPAGWNMRDIPNVVAAASRLGRLAAEMATENIGVDWRQEATKQGVDPDELFENVVNQIAERMARGDDAGGDA